MAETDGFDCSGLMAEILATLAKGPVVRWPGGCSKERDGAPDAAAAGSDPLSQGGGRRRGLGARAREGAEGGSQVTLDLDRVLSQLRKDASLLRVAEAQEQKLRDLKTEPPVEFYRKGFEQGVALARTVLQLDGALSAGAVVPTGWWRAVLETSRLEAYCLSSWGQMAEVSELERAERPKERKPKRGESPEEVVSRLRTLLEIFSRELAQQRSLLGFDADVLGRTIAQMRVSGFEMIVKVLSECLGE